MVLLHHFWKGLDDKVQFVITARKWSPVTVVVLAYWRSANFSHVIDSKSAIGEGPDSSSRAALIFV